jgi:predicted AAA+ superfamily ATPase
MIKRYINDNIARQLGAGKAIILLGARQVGKSTVLREQFKGKNDVYWASGDEPDVRELFRDATSTRLRQFFSTYKYVILDEAQWIPDIGRKLKLFTDFIPEIQVIATGSSAFELANDVNEPLTGRKYEHHLLPLSYGEMVQHHNLIEERRSLPHRLIYGYYPEVVTNVGNEKHTLKLLSESYLYKDVLMVDHIKKSDKIVTLLKALAYQVGSQVSNNELSRLVGIDSKTIERYLVALEQSYVIFRLSSYCGNLRSELKNSKKIFFYDNGIRNALITDFRIPEIRNDLGLLWENFLIAERFKKIHREDLWLQRYFWRTKEQREVDYLEVMDGQISAYEFKWNPKPNQRVTRQFTNAYPDAKVTIVSKDNYEDFIM